MGEVVLKRPSDGHRSFNHREIRLLHGLGGELVAHGVERLLRARDKHEPGSPCVYAVERAGHKGLVSY